jgi:hypothetical protein
MDFIKNNITEGIIAGLAVPILIFIWNRVFKLLNLNGGWIAKIKVRESSYKPYVGLTAEFEIHIIQKDNTVNGTGEKIKNSNHGAPDTIYERAKRPVIEFEGRYERNLPKRGSLYLNVIEHGRLRTTRGTYHLTKKSRNLFFGYFESTAADAKGEVSLTRSKAYFK